MLRLALADIWHERVLFLCSALGCAAVLAPLILLFGLRQGVVAGLRAELLEDPRAREVVSVAHRLGKHVHVWFHSWSTEDAAQMHRLLDLGVDGIVTDHIDILRDVLAERGTPL